MMLNKISENEEIKLMSTNQIEEQMERLINMIKKNEKEIEHKKYINKALKEYLEILKNGRWKR